MIMSSMRKGKNSFSNNWKRNIVRKLIKGTINKGANTKKRQKLVKQGTLNISQGKDQGRTQRTK